MKIVDKVVLDLGVTSNGPFVSFFKGGVNLEPRISETIEATDLRLVPIDPA